MNVGLLHLAEKSWGGVFQYASSVVYALADEGGDEENYIVIDSLDSALEAPASAQIAGMPSNRGLFRRALQKTYTTLVNASPLPISLMVPFGLTTLGRWNRSANGPRSLGLELLVCPYPTLAGLQLKIPYVMVVHDLMHRYPTEEQYRWKEKVLRDVIYKRGAKNALLTVVTSEQTKEDLHRFYAIPREKIRITPTAVPPYVHQHRDMTDQEVSSTLSGFNLPDRFVFYPAQFWRHKNHVTLVKALHWIKQEHGLEVPVVFVGAPREAYDEVMALISQLGLGAQVFDLGYVSEKEIVALYKRSVALVMPTLHNVTNIPIVEALVLGTCCLCADYEPLRDHVGDAGLYFDPRNEREIGAMILSVWNDEGLRRRLIERGDALVQQRYTPQAFSRWWHDIIKEAELILRGPDGRDIHKT